MNRVVTIALHTFKESVRDNVLYSLIVFALLLIGASILLGYISVGIEQIILVNLSLSAISVIGLVMAVSSVYAGGALKSGPQAGKDILADRLVMER